MIVQRIIIPERNIKSWMLLDDNSLPIKPVIEFLDYQRCLQRSPNTLRALAYRLKLFWEFIQDCESAWEELGPRELASFIEWLRWPQSSVSTSTATFKRSTATINVTLAAVFSFYRFHSRSLGLATTPYTLRKIRKIPGEGYQPFLSHLKREKHTLSVVERLTTATGRPRTLSNEEVQRLREACHLKRDIFLTSLLHETGMRIGQVLGLRHEDIRSWNNEIVVKQRDDNANGARAKLGRARENIVHVDEALMALYIDYLTSELENIESDYVFVTLRGANVGRPLEYHSVYRFFRRLQARTGIHATPHLYRHTHATELFETYKWDVSLVQKRLGHSSPQTTEQVYIHSSNTALKEAHSKLVEVKRAEV